MVTRLVLYALLAVGAAALLLVLLAWAAERRLDRLSAPYIKSDAAQLPDIEMALVLGAAPIGPEGGPNRYLEYRLDAAAELWRTGKVKRLIVSGDKRPPDYDEPAAMTAGLERRGVPAAAILRDEEGVRTLASARCTEAAFGARQLIIVSQRFHLARAVFLARELGLEAWGYEARDVVRAYSLLTELRRYPSALRAYYDVWSD